MNICNFIDNESKFIFTLLTDVFKYNLTYSEIGLTDLLIYKLTNSINDNSLKNIDIFKLPSNIKSVFGNDIDIFIQNSYNTYN